jgi:hypothetical protein
VIAPDTPTVNWIQVAIIAAIIGIVIALQAPYPQSQPDDTGDLPEVGDPADTPVPHVIDTLRIEQHNGQAILHVVGAQIDSCEFPVQVDQRRDNNTIYVEIYRLLPSNVRCARMPIPYEARIPIDGDFSGTGTVTFNVNGVVVTAEF